MNGEIEIAVIVTLLVLGMVLFPWTQRVSCEKAGGKWVYRVHFDSFVCEDK